MGVTKTLNKQWKNIIETQMSWEVWNEHTGHCNSMLIKIVVRLKKLKIIEKFFLDPYGQVMH